MVGVSAEGIGNGLVHLFKAEAAADAGPMAELDQTEPFVFAADETLDIGFESGSCVTTEYSSNRFSGDVNWMQIDVGEDANRRVCCCSAQLGEQC